MIRRGYFSQTKFFLFLAAVFLFSGILNPLQAQSFDYNRHPKLDFSFNHLTLELNLDPGQQLLEGQASYEVQANIRGVDSLVLNAAHMDIRNVQVGETDVPFRLGNDSLFINLQNPAEEGQSYTVSIRYETSPKFGIHFKPDSTVWSSLLPISTRHWLPVVDHPRVSFTTDITLIVPATASAVAPGRRESEEVTSVESKAVQWVSNRAIPSSALWFAVGSFSNMETSFGIKQIRISGNKSMMEQSGKRLLETAYNLLGETEEKLGVEYPYQTLQLIVLDDHRWETKQYGAGAIFIYKNRGSLEAQLRRGIFAQWFGVMQREEQWSDAEAITLYQTVLAQRSPGDATSLLTDKANPETSVNPYHVFSPSRWNRWQKFYSSWSASAWRQQIEESLNSELAENAGVKSWSDYADIWYAESGQPWFKPPPLVVPEQKEQVQQQDSIVYQVDYEFNETSGELTLNFEAEGPIVSELVALPLIQHTAQSTDTLEVTFTGKSESVMFSLDPMVTYVDIDASGREDLFLKQNKPVPFLLSQLRNTESTQEKAEAARQLGHHSENPDIQLAISDFLSKNQPPEVRAALLSSMGDITQGASGTEQQFLDAIREENLAIKQAAAGALRHYYGNSQVIQRLLQVAVQSDTLPLFKTATNSLLATVDSADTTPLTQFAQQIMNQDTSGQKAVFVFRRLAEQGKIQGAELVNNLALLTDESYMFPVRAQAQRLLMQVDEDQDRWATRIENLLTDNDPRIRFLGVRSIANKDFLNAQDLLKNRMLDEYDGRVFYEMRKAIQ